MCNLIELYDITPLPMVDAPKKKKKKVRFIDEVEKKEKEWTEYEVEYGYMIDHQTLRGESYITEGYDDEKDAKAEYDMLVRNKEYDYVWLVMSHMEGEDCMCSETIEEWQWQRA
jgi:hypothetical protein